MSKLKDITGQKFGKLIAIKCIKRDKYNRAIWLCKCDCGNLTEVKIGSLTSGNTKSCGCLRKETTIKSHTKHNKCSTRLYRIYYNMRSRCYYRKSNRYKNYGARGIKICDEWLTDFMNFYNWAMNNGYQEGLTIDRIDTNGNYEPGNCRWVGNKSQARNRCSNKSITINGETHWPIEKCLQTTKNNV